MINLGTKAVSDYFRHYKIQDKALDQDKCAGAEQSIYSLMLHRSTKSMQLPVKCGVVKSIGTKKNLNLGNHMLGNKYISIVSEGIKKLDFDIVDLRNNRLNEKGASKVLKNIRISSKILDLSRNRVGKSVKLLKPVLLHKDSKLQRLNLSKNNLGDIACNDLLQNLQQNKLQEYLNLAENNLTDKIAEKLSELLFHHSSLCEVYLRWNSLSSNAGKKIFAALIKNDLIKVLDLSWNILGDNLKSSSFEKGINYTFIGFFIFSLKTYSNFFFGIK